ncbi:MAG: sulfate adenylyltransferase subunit 2 [Candidatus Dadabacteria bacterium]|nr:MAG: sulfate adenylyltransferase subunit 2 [Candidatus Dadabacteria bacterium]
MAYVNLSSVLRYLEEEAIYILREAAAQFNNPVMLFSVGKDSSVLGWLAKKAFYPQPIPFPLLHIDTGYKFKEMLEFRDKFASLIGAKLLVYRNEESIKKGVNPKEYGIKKCCEELKTKALLAALKRYNFDAAIGGARREEEKSRAKERIFSVRDKFSQWDPRSQRPELWDLLNGHLSTHQSVRIFPLSNWTELDVWEYIKAENIPVVSLYFAKKRKVTKKENIFFILGVNKDDTQEEEITCRFRTLGCYHCTGAVESNAESIDEIIAELKRNEFSERITRIIDKDAKSSMEDKKREGYF